MPKELVGVCVNYQDEKKKILINRDSWQEYEEYSSEMFLKKQLIFHEMGHCVLGKTHHNEKLYGGFPVSIMNESLFAQHNFYQENESVYLEELFLENIESSTYQIPFNDY